MCSSRGLAIRLVQGYTIDIHHIEGLIGLIGGCFDPGEEEMGGAVKNFKKFLLEEFRGNNENSPLLPNN